MRPISALLFSRRLTSLLDYVAKYATKESADEAGEEDHDDDEMSSVGDFDSEDEDPAGDMEV